MNTTTQLVGAGAENSRCLNCNTSFSPQETSLCPGCGLPHGHMICLHCGESFLIPENRQEERYFSCPNCGGESFRPFYYEGITEYPLVSPNIPSLYPEGLYPPIELTTDYPFEYDVYPALLIHDIAKPVKTRILPSSQKEYDFQFEENSALWSYFIRIRGLILTCNTLDAPDNASLRVQVRDKRNSLLQQDYVTPEKSAQATCTFDFGLEQNIFTQDIALSLQWVRDGLVLDNDIVLFEGESDRITQWKDVSDNTFTPALILYGYGIKPDTGERVLFNPPTTAYPETEYPMPDSLDYAVLGYKLLSMEHADSGQFQRVHVQEAVFHVDQFINCPEATEARLESIIIPICKQVEELQPMEVIIEGLNPISVSPYRYSELGVCLELGEWCISGPSVTRPTVITVRMSDNSSFPTFVDNFSQKQLGIITAWCPGFPNSAYPETEYPETEYPTTQYPTTEYQTTEYSENELKAFSSETAAQSSRAFHIRQGLTDEADSSSSSSDRPTEAYPPGPFTDPEKGSADDYLNSPCPTTGFPEVGLGESEKNDPGADGNFGGGGGGGNSGEGSGGNSGLPNGRFSTVSTGLKLEMATSASLRYEHIFRRRIGAVNAPVGDAFSASQVCVVTERGYPRFTDFTQDDNGTATDRTLTKPEQLRKITIQTNDDSGIPPETHCFEEILKDGTLIRYSAETGGILSVKTPNSSWISASEMENDIRIIYEEEPESNMSYNIHTVEAQSPGVIRQIWSLRDGLLDVTTQSATKYTISWYTHENISGFNEQSGLYELVSEASPIKSWITEGTLISYRIENGKKYENGTNRLLTDDDLTYLKSIRLTEQIGDHSFVSNWEQQDSSTLILTRGEGDEAEVRVTQRIATDPASYEELLEEYPALDGSFLRVGDTYTREIEEINTIPDLPGGSRIRYRRYPFGDVCTFREEGVGMASPVTTSYEYDMDPASRCYGCCVKETHSDGKVVILNYDARKRLISQTEPWAGGTSKIVRYTYDNRQEYLQRTVSTTEFLLVDGVEKEITRIQSALVETPALKEEITTQVGIGTPLNGQKRVSVTQWYGPDVNSNGAASSHAANRIKMRRSADGVEYHYLYENSTLSDVAYTCTVTQKYLGDVIPGGSSQVVHYYDATDLEMKRREYVYALYEDGHVLMTLVDEESYVYDASHRRVRTNKLNGSYTSTVWFCAGPLEETDENGLTTCYQYNSARRVTRVVKEAPTFRPKAGESSLSCQLPMQITDYVYDAAGREIRNTMTMGDMVTSTQTEWDGLNRVVSRTDGGGLVTTYTYSNDGLETTETTPAGATIITRYHTDGSLLVEAGTGQQACFYSYSATNWELINEKRLNASNGPLVSRVYSSGLGQTLWSLEAKSPGSELFGTLYEYDTAGRLVYTQEENRPPVLKRYGRFGNLIREEKGRLVNEYSQLYVCRMIYVNTWGSSSSLEWSNQMLVWLESTQTRFEYDGFSQKKSAQWNLVSKELAHVQQVNVRSDEYFRKTFSWLENDRGTEYVYSLRDDSENRSFSVSLGGRMLKERRMDDSCTLYSYDYTAEGLCTRVTDSRGNTTIRQDNLSGRPLLITDAEGTATSFVYDPLTGALVRQIQEDGKTLEQLHDHRGRLTAQFGTAVQPMRFEYDEANRMTALHTWRVPEQEMSLSPALRADGDVTRWSYDVASGLLATKTMPDGKQTVYSYGEKGQLLTFTQANGVKTNYTYDLNDNLLSIQHDHGDNNHLKGATQGVFFTRNDWGDITEVSDAFGKRSFRYDGLGFEEAEKMDGLYQASLKYTKQRYDGMDKGFVLMVNDKPCLEMEYVYDDSFRISQLKANGNQVYTYTWNSVSGLLEKVTYPNGLKKEFTYEATRNNVQQINYAKADGSSVAACVNSFDELGRLTSRQVSAGSTRSHNYEYNNRSEVIGDTLVGGDVRGYSYDNIGNRITSSANAATRSYTANNLNQYTAITSSNPTEGRISPWYDENGNQMSVNTETGEWFITWDALDRPVTFVKGDRRIECIYDYMGRRVQKAEFLKGTPVSKKQYVYKGYQLIAELDALGQGKSQVEKTWIWDPTAGSSASPLNMYIHPETIPDTEYPETEYPVTEYPDTEYPVTEYPDTDYPDTEYPEEKFFRTADLYWNDNEQGAHIEYSSDSTITLSLGSLLIEDKKVCIDRVELALDASQPPLSECDTKYKVAFENKGAPGTVYAELEENILKIDFTERDLEVSEETTKLEIYGCPLGDLNETWSLITSLPYYCDHLGKPLAHVSGIIKNMDTTAYDETEYLTEYVAEYQASANGAAAYSSTEYVDVLSDGEENRTRGSNRSMPAFTSTTEYEQPDPEMISEVAYTYFPSSVPYEDLLLRWETGEGTKRTRSISELDLDFNGELSIGKKLVLNALYLSAPGMSLSHDLIAEIYVDKQYIGRVICEIAVPDYEEETDRCLIVDLAQAGIAESLRTMVNKKIMVKFKTGTGAYTSFTGYLDNRYRPTVQLNGILVDEIDNSEKYYYHPDHNKNIIAQSNTAGEITATWDYDAFGNITAQTGTTASKNPFRFSSEYHDENLGLIYYNYRHYNPRDGRWISRDPIGEEGGKNLYAFIRNAALIDFDALGYNKGENRLIDRIGVKLFNMAMDAQVKVVRSMQKKYMEEYNNVSEEMLEKSNIQIVELEHGCRICCERMTGKFYQTNITIGQEGKIHLASLNNCKPKDQTVFVVHSHPPQLGGASEQDLYIHRNGFGDKNNPMNGLTVVEENKIKMSSPVSAGWGRIAPPYIGSKFTKKDKTSKLVPKKEVEPLNKRLVYGYDVIEIEILLGGVRQMPHFKRLNPNIEGK